MAKIRNISTPPRYEALAVLIPLGTHYGLIAENPPGDPA